MRSRFPSLALLCFGLFFSLPTEANEAENAQLVVSLSGPSSVTSGEDVSVVVDLSNQTATNVAIRRRLTRDEAILGNRFYLKGPIQSQPTRKREYEESPEALSNSASSVQIVFLSPGNSIQEYGTLNHFYDLTVPGVYTAQIRNISREGVVRLSNAITFTVKPLPR